MTDTSRREFLQATVAGAALSSAPWRSLLAAEPKPIAAIDAHTHFYDPTRPEGVPWPSPQSEQLYRTMLPADFLKVARPCGVSSTIVVEASPWVEDNQWLLDLADRESSILGVVGHLEPAADDFAKHLKRFAANPRFRGLRIGHDVARKALADKSLLTNLQRLADHDLELDINGGPAMPADAARMARLCPDLRIVINHAGNVRIDGKPVPDDWRKGMQAAAAEGERVFCKVSALVEATRSKDGEAPDDVDYYRPVLEALWTTFGENRLIYASNWPVSERAAPYATVHKIASTYFASHGPTALKKFLRENALAAYKPPLPAQT